MSEGRRDEAGAASGRRPPWGLLGMLGLVLAIESTLAGHDLDFTTPMHWDWRVIGRAATRPERVAGKDVLLFGDSLVKFGVMPRVIEARTGRDTYNFALHTGQASSSYFMLRRTLEAGARPSAVVLDLTPHMLMHFPQINNSLWPELLSPRECLDLSRSMWDFHFFNTTLLASVLPSYKERHDVRAGLVATLGGRSVSRREQIPMYRRNWKVNAGAQLMGDGPAPAINAEEWANTLYARWFPHPVNVAYLDRFLEMSRSRGIRVYWLLPPIHPDVQAKTEATGFDVDYTGFVSGVRARFPEVVVVDARHSGFTPDQFYDGAHLNRRGALGLSAALAEVLRDLPADGEPGRWAALDLGRAGAVDLPMEDVPRSAAIVQRAQARARR